MSMLTIALYCLLLLVLYKVVLRPLCYLAFMKLKHGSKIHCVYFPFVGSTWKIAQGMQKYGDPLHFHHELKRTHPEVEAVIGIGFHLPEIILLSPHLVKEALVLK